MRIIFAVLAIASGMLPLWLMTICALSPFQHGSEKIWIHCDYNFEIDVRDSSGFRAVFAFPAALLYLASAALPVLWAAWLYSRWPRGAKFHLRRTFLVAMVTALIGWPAAIAYVGSPSEISEHIGSAIAAFITLCPIVVLAWLVLWAAQRFHDYRIRTGLANQQRCVRCGYDLRATPHRCPECGNAPNQFR